MRYCVGHRQVVATGTRVDGCKVQVMSVSQDRCHLVAAHSHTSYINKQHTCSYAMVGFSEATEKQVWPQAMLNKVCQAPC